MPPAGPTCSRTRSDTSVNLSVIQENLARGLSVVSHAVSSRSTLPVLANVLLRTEDAGLKLTATNLEIGITYWVPGKIETDGAHHGSGAPADRRRRLPPERAHRPRASRRRPAAPSLRTLRDPPPRDRRRRVPGDPGGGRASHDPRQPEGPEARPRRGCLRRGERRGAADPHRRADPLRGRPDHPGRGRQLSDRDHHDPGARRRRGDERGGARPLVQRAGPGPRGHRRSRRDHPLRPEEPGPLPPRGRATW